MAKLKPEITWFKDEFNLLLESSRIGTYISIRPLVRDWIESDSHFSFVYNDRFSWVWILICFSILIHFGNVALASLLRVIPKLLYLYVYH